MTFQEVIEKVLKEQVMVRCGEYKNFFILTRIYLAGENVCIEETILHEEDEEPKFWREGSLTKDDILAENWAVACDVIALED